VKICEIIVQKKTSVFGSSGVYLQHAFLKKVLRKVASEKMCGRFVRAARFSVG